MTTLELRTKIGPITVKVDNHCRGLAVHRALDGRGWVVTHAPSGMKVADFGTRKAARLAMRGLLRIVSWKRTAEQLARHRPNTKRRVLACIKRHGGTRDE